MYEVHATRKVHGKYSPAGRSLSMAKFESSCIRKIKVDEVNEAWHLEAQSFPHIPATVLPIERFIDAQKEAPELFWGNFVNGNMTGFIVGTLSAGSRKWAHNSLFKHNPKGTVACVNVLCVYPEYRKMGIGTALMKHLAAHIEENFKGVTKLCLICKAKRMPFYEQIGFIDSGSAVITWLGPLQRYFMEYRIPAAPKDSA